MVTFVVPEYHSVAHFALGLLLERAQLDHIGSEGKHELTISLARDDVTLLQEIGIVQGECDTLESQAPEIDKRMAICREFENELIDLQKKVEVSLAKARMSCI